MLGFNFLKNCKITRVNDGEVAGTADVVCTTIDMQGFDSVCFIASIGALTATQVTSLNAAGGAASDGSDASDLAGTDTGAMADTDSDLNLVLDLVRPTQRFITATVERGTANAVLDGVTAILYNARKEPITQDATVSKSKTVVSPATGTP